MASAGLPEDHAGGYRRESGSWVGSEEWVCKGTIRWWCENRITLASVWSFGGDKMTAGPVGIKKDVSEEV